MNQVERGSSEGEVGYAKHYALQLSAVERGSSGYA